MEFNHVSVMLNECINGLNIKPGGIYVDGTAGGAGHSKAIAQRLDPQAGGKLIAIDRDPDAVKVATQRLEGLPAQVVKGNYSQIDSILEDLGIDKVDGILLDLGVSSFQLDNAGRGFSYHTDAPLDMRMSREGFSARDVVNNYSFEQLAKIIFEYGEEKYARSIAMGILKAREHRPLETTLELAEAIKSSVPQRVRREKNPCKKTFQAIRIEVNSELEHLSIALDKTFDCLNTAGRLCIISFHSLEDRLVKQRFKSLCTGCTCPPDFPVCICGKKPRGKMISSKPIEASEQELAVNNRSHSAKLRIIEKL
ncbi:16S rRNA (cytosine(1402)-N(4))-methyltransferase RsmH [Ruminococcus sp. FC2018]|uniref:16S rRNA (cytosine(1402)-N(4))-methyltransferase RsmH n=1 Tax=Ruminococcus sp. FC2018 TaxID=1410617 RepID=UPI00048FC4A3|nr:16S rRNA (cytosine(1402)-N(4))-methyltransferase RsmH [Ruminococcus sp. FC2018]